ncbi:MAG: fibrobacter succinogenes major paralogous domain-containing protein [Bacteroidetes bacterium]|nr:fibrobacter succinogenes major paralogous domain-containing protein [Bacteroidota bacterium]
MTKKTIQIALFSLLAATILLSPSCKKQTEEDPPGDEIVIAEEAKVIEESTWNQNFIAIDSTNFTLTFSKNEAIENIKAGDIIVSSAGEGLLRRVSSVEIVNNQIVIRTSEATLTDLIQQGLIDFQQQLTIPQIKSIEYHYGGIALDTLNYKNGNETQFNWNIDIVLYDEDGNVQTTGDQIKLTGDFSCDWLFLAKIDIGLIDGLKEVKFGFESNENLNLRHMTGIEYNFEKNYTLATVNFTPIVVIVGIVPLVFTPKLKIVVGVDGSANASITTGVSQSVAFESGLQYLKDSGWDSYETFENSFGYQSPQVNVDAGAEAYLKPEFTVKLYSVTGPFTNLKLYGKLDADLLATPWWELHGGLKMAAGVKVEILDKFLLDFTVSDLINYEVLIAEAPDDTETFTDPRDGQTYKTVTIGDQTWFAENLNYETANSWTYDDDPANGDIYGRLYTWDAALTACPSGWHLPTDDEWKTMEMALGMSQSEADASAWRGTDQGIQMKSTSGWYDNGNGTNSSDFNALPGGDRGSSGSFYNLGGHGYWWSSTEGSGTRAWYRSLGYSYDQVYRNYYYKTHGFSVRCLKD